MFNYFLTFSGVLIRVVLDLLDVGVLDAFCCWFIL